VVDAELVRRRSMYQKDSRHTRAPGDNFRLIFRRLVQPLISMPSKLAILRKQSFLST
jgi:hypothetical protein